MQSQKAARKFPEPSHTLPPAHNPQEADHFGCPSPVHFLTTRPACCPPSSCAASLEFLSYCVRQLRCSIFGIGYSALRFAVPELEWSCGPVVLWSASPCLRVSVSCASRSAPCALRFAPSAFRFRVVLWSCGLVVRSPRIARLPIAVRPRPRAPATPAPCPGSC